jgi:hypothetical protein
MGQFVRRDTARMSKPRSTASEDSGSFRRPSRMTLIWLGLLLAWFAVLCLVPDPRPLGAPEFAVKGVRLLVGVSDPIARAFATIALRGMGLAMIGVLLVQSFGRARPRIAVPAVLILAPLLAVLAQWINYTYFPIAPQVWLGAVSAVLGVLLGFTLRRNGMAMAALVILAVGLFVWGTSTGISDDLYDAVRATGLHVLEIADEIPKGDEGFEKLIEVAFAFAEDNSHGRDPILTHRAAILALGVILGEEKVAKVAKREIDLARLSQAEKLRHRITLHGRRDLARHFWVSAGLAVLSDGAKSMAVGIAKEMMDSVGGSGFSFVDLTVDRAGTLFTVAATRNEESARAMQARIRDGVVIADFVPNPLDLPEGIGNDDFQAEYGGLGGEETRKIVEEIRRRLDACEGLR